MKTLFFKTEPICTFYFSGLSIIGVRKAFILISVLIVLRVIFFFVFFSDMMTSISKIIYLLAVLFIRIKVNMILGISPFETERQCHNFNLNYTLNEIPGHVNDPKTKVLFFFENSIEYVRQDMFDDLPMLMNLSFNNNKIREVSTLAFSKNPLLEEVIIICNPGMILKQGVFKNLTRLKKVELSYNDLTLIPENTFENCQNLDEIYLGRNLLHMLSKSLFHNLTTLKILDLSYNELTNLPQSLFYNLKNLKELDLRRNNLNTIGDVFTDLISLEKLAFGRMSKSLIYLDISDNKWNDTYTNPGSTGYSALDQLIAINDLILHHNQFTRVPSLLATQELRTLDLRFNKISHFEVAEFIPTKKHSIMIDLRYNQVQILDFSFVEHISQYIIRHYTHVKSDNFYKRNIIKLADNPILCDCNMFDFARYNFREIDLVNIINIELDSSRLCECFFIPFNKTVVIDCSFKKLKAYPQFKLNDNEFHFNQTFLNMRGNNLTMGPHRIDESYDNITKLDLSQNLLTTVSWIPPRLVELNLTSNLLRNLNDNFLGKLRESTALSHLYLRDNPWECSCKSLNMQRFLFQFYHKVNSSDIYCKQQKQFLIKLTNLCYLSFSFSVLILIVFTILLFGSILYSLYYRYQTEIKIYLYARNMCLWFVTEDELDKDKIYDVFVSYANKDEHFVVEHLLPELENSANSFKVCIHIRDWFPGEFIADQVIRSVRDSKRTLVVLSNHFLESVWGKMEFRTAHTQAISEKRARVIVVIFGELDENKLDDELKRYLTTNTYVKWGDKYFWEKLKFALPHNRKVYKKDSGANVYTEDNFVLDRLSSSSI
ncbi:hypothetical protein ABEB36_014836 [Hypothenemus hampei]|uniref:TIR domain-containing protein n=1 Tax=Hypothenemus hampei TaxID=57062 RepID=A0ABD1E3R7_HYPHA